MRKFYTFKTEQVSYPVGSLVLGLTSILLAMFLTACGGGGGGGSGTNTLPTVNAGPDQVVNEGATVQLAGSGDDTEGAVTYSWLQTGGTSVSLLDSTSATPTFEAPQVAASSSEVIILELTVTDNDGESVANSVSITVNDVAGVIPIVDAGSDQSVISNATVSLNGSGSGNNPPFTYSWAQTSGTNVSLSDITLANPSFTAPVVTAGNPESLVFELTVTDAGGNMATDQITVVVNAQAPTQSRIKRVEYDYDNNGTPDAIATLTYDAAGRVIKDEYLYSDDGTADLFVLIKENKVTTDITYDSNGRIQSHKRVDDDDGGVEFSYSYDSTTGFLARTDVVISDVLGNITSETYFLYTYVSNRVERYDGYLLSNDMLLVSSVYTYDTNGRIIEDKSLSSIGAINFIRRYTWDTNGRLDLEEFDGNVDGTFEVSIDYVFDSVNGRLIRRINTDANQFAVPYTNYTELFSYDANGLLAKIEYDNNHDGSIDGNTTPALRENGPCLGTYIPFLIPNAGQDGKPDSNTGNFTWCD